MYKKLFVAMAAVAAAVTANAQTQKGSQLLGGSLYFSTAKQTASNFGYYDPATYNTTTRNVRLGIGPNYSYFIADGLDVGINGSYMYYNERTNTDVAVPSSIAKSNGHGFSVGANLRKYFLYNGKFGVRTGPFVQYAYDKQNMRYQGQDGYPGYFDNKTFNAGIGLDLAFFPTKRIGLAASLGSIGYSHINSKQSNSNIKRDSFDLSLTSGLAISAFYAFGN